ncbi:L-ascorbate metabolism protein UlaG, beta-lactamase superfamily [Dyadobacter koreensis]|uniref:L-ascorbate metabolism protein UlaG, beta-lactamase superfamily n=2 Tax=Dyadobacter koreensis TaxID=408657 RepID=A0A1H6XR73_9BACT|nr:L-ascorbate metabolism protein UlaG, beta-lactamase superfamily [Dyadobacter koreensis]
MLLILVALTALVVISVYIFLQQPKFGKTPSGSRQARIEKSQNFKDGQFQNLNFTPDLAEGVSYFKVLKEFIFNKSKNAKPASALPSVHSDLLHLNPAQDILVWFGHSSYFMQIDGKTMLVDPVFSGSASPVKFTTRSFPGSDVYSVEDFPEIDFLFISHDHWDHLDFETVTKLKSKVKRIITGLGTGQHFETWGFDMAKVEEKDWNEAVDLGDGFTVNITQGRHFSGRGLSRNRAMWVSFVLRTPSKKMFLGGDSGYDTHFKSIGEKFGPFDLVLLECGQYNKNWKYIHMMPEEVVQAAEDLKAKKLMPVHWAKFELAQHAWDEPIIRVSAASKLRNIPLVTPMIGEVVNLDEDKIFSPWWEKVK